MINNINYVSINEIASRITRHPLMADLTLEPIIQYTVDFINLVGLPQIYTDKQETIQIENHRGILPCDLVSIKQVRDSKNKTVFRATTNTFNPEKDNKDYTFKSQGRVIFTSNKTVTIDVAYTAMPIDENELPLIPDDGVFLTALTSYIKLQHFTILSDLNKVAFQSLQNAQQEYFFNVGKLQNRYNMPSLSEMENITNMLNQFFPRSNEFNKGFRGLGNREYLKRH